MADAKTTVDRRKVVDETWYEYLSMVVVAEEYEGGGVLFFLVTLNNERKPFTNIKSLNEEGSVVTKEEAMAMLENLKRVVEQFPKSARPSA